VKKEETKFKERVLCELEKLSLWAEKIQQVSIRGTPDILICANGTFVALELKTDVGVLSALQEYKLSCIRETGGIAIVSTPKSWPKDLETIKKIVNSRPTKSKV